MAPEVAGWVKGTLNEVHRDVLPADALLPTVVCLRVAYINLDDVTTKIRGRGGRSLARPAADVRWTSWLATTRMDIREQDLCARRQQRQQ